MSLSRRVKQESLASNSLGYISVPAGQSNVVLSQAFTIYDPVHIRVDIRVTAGSGTVTFKLQVSPGNDTPTDGSPIWIDCNTQNLGSFSGPVEYRTITLLAEKTGDQQYLPLPGAGRIVVTTGGGGANVTVDRIVVLS